MVCTNDDSWVDLDLFYANVKFGYTGVSIGKSETVDFSESIAACGLKLCTCRQLIELMEVSEN